MKLNRRGLFGLFAALPLIGCSKKAAPRVSTKTLPLMSAGDEVNAWGVRLNNRFEYIDHLEGSWVSGGHVRFTQGEPQTIGGWEV